MRDCFAILEQVDQRQGPSADLGASNGCLFCVARINRALSDGSRVVVLNGYKAGQTFELISQNGNSLFLRDNSNQSELVIQKNGIYLVGQLPFCSVPEWMPPFNFRTCFIIDELEAWFCNNSIIGANFVWNDDSFVEVVRVIWEKRISITALELTRLFCAHGLPTVLHKRFSKAFTLCMSALIAARQREPIKKMRLNSFDNFRSDTRRWCKEYLLG